MRCPGCQRENPARAKFCQECGRRLPSGCPACGAPLPEAAKFCAECGAPVVAVPVEGGGGPAAYTPRHLAETILASRSALEGERKSVTVLFCDLVSSTALAEQLGPEGMHVLVNGFFETALGQVHRYEGTVNQFLGDGFMALFGAPLAHEDHARRAVLAALGIRRELEDRALPTGSGPPVRLRLRQGLHTGFVVVGAIGDNLRMDYTAVGDTTHLAARLQQLAEPGAIVVSEATARLVRGYVSLEALGPVEVRGRSTPIAIHRVTGLGPRRSPLEGLDERPLSQFVGRHRELGILTDLLAEVEAGRGQAAGVVGEPGVGKSRLLIELRLRLAARRVDYLEGRCLSFGGAIPYLPVLDLVRGHCGLNETDAPDTVAEKVRITLADIGLAAEAAPFLLHLLGIKEGTESLAGLSPEAIKTRTFDTLRQLSLRSSRQRPLVIAIEDVHWADSASEEYFGSLVEALAGARIMLLVTYRPGHRPPWLEKSYATQLSLGRLDATHSLAVVRSVLPRVGLADPLASLILDKAEGNPFFLEELARAVAEQDPARPSLTVPDTVHGVLAARIDRLADAPKRLLQTASILGRELSVRQVQALWEGGDVDQLLHQLTRQEFLYERSGAEETTYVFKHALTQEVAESTILAPRRRELHLRAAEALAELYPERRAELAPVLAHHCYEAEAWALACDYATRAAEAASAAYANREARERYDQALAAAERAGLPPGTRMRLHAARAHVLSLLGAFEPARIDLETALGLAGDARTRATFLAGLSALWGGHRNYARGLELARQAVRTAEEGGDRRALAEALVQAGLMQVNLAQMGESRRQLERALEIFRDLGDERGYAQTLDVLAMVDGISGQIQRSVERGREALHRFRALGDRMAEPSTLSTIAFWLGLGGQRAEGEALGREGLEAAIAVGARRDEACSHIGLGWVLHLYGDYGQAWREATTALELAREIGHREFTAAALFVLGRIAHVCGQPDRARQLHEEMLATTRELGGLWVAGALGELGVDLLALGDEEAGTRLLGEAVATAGEAVEFVVQPLLGESELWLRRGRPEAALETARRAEAAAPEYVVWAIDARRLQGQALLALGRRAEGERILREASDEAQAIGAEPPRWRSAMALADLLAAEGRHDEAVAARAAAAAAVTRVAAGLPDDLRSSFLASPLARRATGG